MVLKVAIGHRASQIKPGRPRLRQSASTDWRPCSAPGWKSAGVGRELAGFGADDEPEKLQMVRRRSTVRFRKGAPQVRGLFLYRTGDSFGGYSSGRNRSAARPGAGTFARPQAQGCPGLSPGPAGECVGALWGARSLSSGLEGHVRSGGRWYLASYSAGFARARRRVE
jgi:hypothetical protein